MPSIAAARSSVAGEVGLDDLAARLTQLGGRIGVRIADHAADLQPVAGQRRRQPAPDESGCPCDQRPHARLVPDRVRRPTFRPRLPRMDEEKQERQGESEEQHGQEESERQEESEAQEDDPKELRRRSESSGGFREPGVVRGAGDDQHRGCPRSPRAQRGRRHRPARRGGVAHRARAGRPPHQRRRAAGGRRPAGPEGDRHLRGRQAERRGGREAPLRRARSGRAGGRHGPVALRRPPDAALSTIPTRTHRSERAGSGGGCRPHCGPRAGAPGGGARSRPGRGRRPLLSARRQRRLQRPQLRPSPRLRAADRASSRGGR